ncbi:MAG: endolytic transglycosylase MltG [Rhodobiaceae bacterium]|jgi:UPF0755 protein|nr:endolytic transglycosylase MltG [Rhodobiaceae bacterium]
MPRWFLKRSSRLALQPIVLILNRFRAVFLPAALLAMMVLIAVLGLIFMSGPQTQAKQIELLRGSTLRAVTVKLDEQGLLRSAFLFRVYARLRGQATALKAGEFSIPAGANMHVVLKILTRGEVMLHAITLAEGLTSQNIVAQLRGLDLLKGEVAIPPEGSLLPETYKVPRGMSRAKLLEKMTRAQTSVIDALWPKRQLGLPIKSKQEAIILASIVERETAVASERPLVAAVFVNRLKKNMRLQSDPTIIYGLVGGQGKLGRPIRRSEIRRHTAYNTYRIKGLPPTPIANPGRAALAAVLNPAASQALYFVADGTGGHVFSKTLAEHNRNVRRWRQIEKQKKR